MGKRRRRFPTFLRELREGGAEIAGLGDEEEISAAREKVEHGVGILGEAAATRVAVPAGVDEALACCELGEALSCFLHIERFTARSKGRITNRIIIKEVNALSAPAQKTSAFCNREQ